MLNIDNFSPKITSSAKVQDLPSHSFIKWREEDGHQRTTSDSSQDAIGIKNPGKVTIVDDDDDDDDD